MLNLQILLATALIPAIFAAAVQPTNVYKYPIEKSKVKYHRQQICIVIRNDKSCVNTTLVPGDAKGIAQLLSIINILDMDKVIPPGEGQVEELSNKEGINPDELNAAVADKIDDFVADSSSDRDYVGNQEQDKPGE